MRIYGPSFAFDLTMVPVALGTMAAVEALARGVQRPFQARSWGSVVAAVVTFLVGWWWSRARGRSRGRAAPARVSDEPNAHGADALV